MEILIRNLYELQALEEKINLSLQRYDLDQVLSGLKQSSEKLHTFTTAGTTLFAIRYSLPPIIRSSHLQWLINSFPSAIEAG